MKVLVTGINGQLGYDVCKVINRRGIENRGVTSADFDITNSQAVKDYINSYRPDAIIHCAAYTAVDKAEDELDRVKAVNVDGTRNIAEACKTINAKMIYLSTDYVFSGQGNSYYEVGDPTGPLGAYGATKLGGEQVVKELLEKYFIVRVSWVFGKNGNNFIKTMLRLAETRNKLNVVSDQIGSPTYTADLAELLCDMVITDKYGTYHASNEGVCSWAEFAEEIFLKAEKSIRVNHIPTSEYPTRAVRPLNSRMSKKSLIDAGFAQLPDWKDALSRYLLELENI